MSAVRCPDNTEHECFFQKRLFQGSTEGLKTEYFAGKTGGSSPAIVLEAEAGLESLAQMGVIEIHNWGTHASHVMKPDLIVFDLDPDNSVPWKEVAVTALKLRKILKDLGLESFLKVSGNKGLHIHVPILPKTSWNQVKSFSNAVALLMVNENPNLYVATMTKAKRKEKIFIDFFRNGYGATSIAPFSLRAKNGGAVALPIPWKGLEAIDPQGFSLQKTLKILKMRTPGGKGDPWKDYFKTKQSLLSLKGLNQTDD